MYALNYEIKNCLSMFGPCTIRTIQEKLDLRGIIVSQNEILDSCEFMEHSKEIKEATGFNDRAYRL